VTDEPDWRADPAWELVGYDPAFFAGREPPARPTEGAELAQPATWASLYDGRKIVATWSRLPRPSGVTSSAPDATVAS
jgi:hypothetical protein